ncbi:MAG: selenium-dependent molybdenum cofactor biosynthesis protein YqeB [Chloroflexota bacterium]
MLFPHHLVLIRGGGDLATGVAYRLHVAGFPIIVTELSHPLVVRRRVALASAVTDGAVVIEDMTGVHVETPDEALDLASSGIIPVLVAPQLPESLFDSSHTTRYSSLILVDARMAKRNIDTRIDQASLVIALGPGFTAGIDSHAVIETNRGHRLGRVIWSGMPEPNTGTPGVVAGKGSERVLRAPVEGQVAWHKEIGERVESGEKIGTVSGLAVEAPFEGVLRGLIAPGTTVKSGLKIGDVDPRIDSEACFTISDKALSIGGGVLEAILSYLNTRQANKS